MTDDTWLETEAEADSATGPAAAALLDSVSQTLQEAPPEKRFDVELEITETE
jgi:hypothetical protein